MNKKAVKCKKMFDPESSSVRENVVIFVEGERITGVSDAASADLTGCEVIDMGDRFVTPGLIDCHVHLSENGEASTFSNRPYETMGDAVLRCLTNATANLMSGFTAIRDCGVSGYIDVALRNAIDRGEFVGPRLMVAGPCLSSTGGHADTHYSPYLEENEVKSGLRCDGPTEMAKAVRTNIKHGVDYIKFMGTGGVLSRGTTVGAQQMSYEEMKAICDTAKMYGVITAVHAHGTNGIKDAVRAGVTSVEHGMLMDEEGVELMKENGTFLVPTLIAAERIVTKGREHGTPEWAIKKAEAVFEHATGVFKRCKEEGVNIAFGTDSATPFNYHGKQGYEFELMCKYGMTIEEALTAATKGGARLMQKYDSIGSVAEGKYADIAAFDGDPREDVKVMTNCTFVMKGGVVVKNVC